jgi:hypothetical protein
MEQGPFFVPTVACCGGLLCFAGMGCCIWSNAVICCYPRVILNLIVFRRYVELHMEQCRSLLLPSRYFKLNCVS